MKLSTKTTSTNLSGLNWNWTQLSSFCAANDVVSPYVRSLIIVRPIRRREPCFFMQDFERMLSYEEYPEEKSRLWSSSFDDMTILSSVVLRKQELSAFLIFALWTSSVTYLTFGKGELQDENHFLSVYSYFSPCYLIFHHSLFLFRWFTTVDALSLQCVNITKLIFAVFRKKKKN